MLSAKKWGVLLLILGVSFFVRMGFWQLSRAEEKAQMLVLAKRHHRRLAFPSNISPNQYQKISIIGEVLKGHSLLLDNQIYLHQVGFNVLTPVKLSSGSYLLVDRGWLKGNANRSMLPKVPKSNNKAAFQGYVYYPSKKTWVLRESIENKGQWPLVIEKIDFKQLELLLGVRLYPFVMRQTSKSNDGLVRQWPVVNVSPARHRAYAFQWFSFAIAAIGIFIVICRRRR